MCNILVPPTTCLPLGLPQSGGIVGSGREGQARTHERKLQENVGAADKGGDEVEGAVITPLPVVHGVDPCLGFELRARGPAPAGPGPTPALGAGGGTAPLAGPRVAYLSDISGLPADRRAYLMASLP